MATWRHCGLLFAVALMTPIKPISAQSNPPPCGFGIWHIGDKCRERDGRICTVVGYAIGGKMQTKCTKLERSRHSGPRATTANRTKAETTKRRISAKANLPTSMDRVVASGVRTKIAHFYALHPNCTSAGPVTVRVITEPQHGTLESLAANGFTTYRSDNVRAKCNNQESEIVGIWYKSADGFTGPDQATVQAIFPGGVYSDLKLLIDVRGNQDQPNVDLATMTEASGEAQAPKSTPTQFAKARVSTIPQTAERVVVSGMRTRIWHFSSLQPDCKSRGQITVRLVSPPKHGTLESLVGKGFTEYPANNIRAKCNAQESEITQVWYKSEEDFVGSDEATIEAIFPTGYYADVKLLIEVRSKN